MSPGVNSLPLTLIAQNGEADALSLQPQNQSWYLFCSTVYGVNVPFQPFAQRPAVQVAPLCVKGFVGEADVMFAFSAAFASYVAEKSPVRMNAQNVPTPSELLLPLLSTATANGICGMIRTSLKKNVVQEE